MKKRYWILLILAVFLLAVYLSRANILESFADYLVVQDQLEKVDCIVILSGDSNGERIQQGAELYKKGLARYFLISGGQLYRNLTYARVMTSHAISLGVPAAAVLIEDRSQSTYENALFSLPIFKKKGIRSIIIVTSPTHSRRSKTTFVRLCDKEGIKVLSYPVQNSGFSKKGWWRRHEDSQQVVLEYVKLAGYFFKGI